MHLVVRQTESGKKQVDVGLVVFCLLSSEQAGNKITAE